MSDTNKKERVALDDELEGVNGGSILVGFSRGGLGARLSNLLHLGGKPKATTLPSTATDAVLSTLEAHTGIVSDDIDKRDLLAAREQQDDPHQYSL